MCETLTDLVDDVARRHPQVVALEAQDGSLTYRELVDESKRVAAELETLTTSSAPVGLFASRDVRTYVDYLGVLRSGRTVIPLNPHFPVARTRQMLERGGVQHVLGARAETFDLCEPRPAPSSAEGRPRSPRPLYILFTSGTTGKPKGIPIGTKQVLAYLREVVPQRALRPGDRVSQFFELTFDPSVFDMFTTWSSGATLVVPSSADLRDPLGFIETRQLTHWASVPSVVSLALRMRQLSPQRLKTLRSTWFAGEALTYSQARAWHAAAPGSTIVNAYGPTELTVTCTWFELDPQESRWPTTSNDTVPIGVVHSNSRWRLASDGNHGELLVAGPQRFDGYLDDADNLGKFSENEPPHNDIGPSTDAWFRTGDNVSMTADGLVHLGRLDQQVQVHGFRVELSEVEAAVRSHPGVDDAVVLMRDGELVAVYSGSEHDRGSLLDLVEQRLPPYMVPTQALRVDQLPLNGNGKIDRSQVLQMTSLQPTSRAS